MKGFVYIERLVPAAGLLKNAARYRGLHCALRVEIQGPGELRYGARVRIGEGTRLDLPKDSVLEIGDDVSISRFAHIVPGSSGHVLVGSRTTVQDDCRIYGDVTIGPCCIFAPNVFVSSGAHVFDALPHLPIRDQDRLAPVASGPIRIFADCWFGINSVVMPGITIGRGCVVGANSVVTTDLPPYSVAVGNPAKIVRQRLSFLPKSRIDATEEKDAPYFYDGFDASLTASGDAFTAGSDFILVLQGDAPRTVRLCLSGDRGTTLELAGRRQPVPQSWGVVSFPLDPKSNSLPFLQFQADGPSRVQWAELA
jgi:acetyltransferase-like isoleucine patch superfamily enzyme